MIISQLKCEQKQKCEYSINMAILPWNAIGIFMYIALQKVHQTYIVYIVNKFPSKIHFTNCLLIARSITDARTIPATAYIVF